jgi:holo-[acyl-carrier protein] synthase
VSPALVLCGTDLVRVGDIAESLSRFGDRFLARVFRPEELATCANPANRTERLAARYAAKEAVLKVLRPRDDEAVPFRDIEIQRQAGGFSEVVLHGRAATLAERHGLSGWSLSMSHERDYATATVVATRAAEERS